MLDSWRGARAEVLACECDCDSTRVALLLALGSEEKAMAAPGWRDAGEDALHRGSSAPPDLGGSEREPMTTFDLTLTLT